MLKNAIAKKYLLEMTGRGFAKRLISKFEFKLRSCIICHYQFRYQMLVIIKILTIVTNITTSVIIISGINTIENLILPASHSVFSNTYLIS